MQVGRLKNIFRLRNLRLKKLLIVILCDFSWQFPKEKSFKQIVALLLVLHF